MSAVDQWLGEVATAALVGSARREPPPVPGTLGLAIADGASAEHRLLASAAVTDALGRAGTTLPPPRGADPVAAPEVRPVTSERATQLLTLLLTQPPVSKTARDELVVEWLRLANGAGQRVPWRLLPLLLDFAAARRRVANAIGGSLGERGRWLVGLNETWTGLIDGDAERVHAPVDWVAAGPTMSSAEAVTAFALGRRADATVARELLEEQWSIVSAKVRADALRALGPGLSTADEPLLERALDDKAKSVREAAASMLDRLPGSARATRMAERLRRLVTVRGTLVRHLEVDVPDAPDASAVRDGLTAPAKGVSPTPTLWLSQIVRGAPLSVWTDVTGRGPGATLKMVRDKDVLAWLVEAVIQHRDREWAVACVDHGVPDPQLLWLLPTEHRARLLTASVTQASRDRDLRGLLAEAPRPWPDDLGRAVLKRIQAEKADLSFGWTAAPLLPVGLSPSLAPEINAALSHLPEDASHLRKALIETLQLHAVRTSLTEAFR